MKKRIIVMCLHMFFLFLGCFAVLFLPPGPLSEYYRHAFYIFTVVLVKYRIDIYIAASLIVMVLLLVDLALAATHVLELVGELKQKKSPASEIKIILYWCAMIVCCVVSLYLYLVGYFVRM